jgi:integrase/recombinase XerD
MAKRNRIVKETCALSLNDLFPRFVASQSAKGVSEKTVKTYQGHFHCIGLHLDTLKPIEELTKEDLENLIIAFRKKGLSPNSISSYSRVLRTMLNWCREMGYTNLQMPPMKDKETLKETYSDEELKRLLQKPDRNCDFCEYRNWAIVSFLLNSGCRASTLRNIQNRDIDLSTKQVRYRHTKTGKVQVIPLCSVMASILRDYMDVRKGEGADYLFCNEYGEMLTENALREAV